jgi:NAD(P)-dependent dehydrogenase (short-subunit alcohol dehydrogenase family)
MFEYLDDKNVSVDALVLNAAHLGVGIKIFESPLSDFVNVLNVNTVWNYCLVENCAIRMREKGDGSIIFINSNTAYRAIPDRIAYSASKGGIIALSKALAFEIG